MNIEQLRAALEVVRGQMLGRDNNNPREAAEVDNLQREEARLLALIQQQEAIIEEKVNEEGIPFTVTGVDLSAFSPDEIEIIEMLVRTVKRNIFTDQAALDAEKDANIASYMAQTELQIANLHRNYAELEQDYNQAAAELKEQTTETLRLITERDEARQNRDNAAAQLAEKDAEIARLNRVVDEYQAAKVLGERGAQKVIDTTAEEVSDLNAALAKLKEKRNKSALDIALGGERFRGKVIIEDGKFETIPAPPVGGSESAVTFRDEAPAAVIEGGGLYTSGDAVEAPDFPSQAEVQNVDPTLGGESVDTALETVTRAEFEELKARVAGIESGRLGEVA